MSAEHAASLESLLAGGFVQDVIVAGPDLLLLSIRRPGASTHLGLSVLAGAPGVMLLADLPAQRADNLLLGMRDLLRARVIGTKVDSVRSADGERAGLRFDFTRKDGVVSVLLDLAGRGNLEVHEAGHAPQALRPPAGELRAALPAIETPTAASDVLDAETARLERLRARLLHERGLDALRSRLHRALKAARSLVVRREADVARLGDAGELRGEADALASHLHLIARGQASLDIADWDGRPLRIALDPSVSAAESLRRLYSRAAKAERGAIEAGGRLDEARERKAALESLIERAGDAALEWPSTIHGSAALAAQGLEQLEHDASRLLRPERSQETSPERRAQRAEESALAPREHVSKDGLRILVGRSAAGNHELTFRIARGNDVWLHARGCPGAHVVLVLPKGAEIPNESLLDAATLAHASSRRSAEPVGEVLWCRAKDVHARRGAPPGQVTTTREKVIHLRLEPGRLARLQRA